MPTLRWYSDGSPFGPNAIGPTGVSGGGSVHDWLWGEVVSPGVGTIVWTPTWIPVSGTSPRTVYPDGPNPADLPSGDVDWVNGVGITRTDGVYAPTSIGELQLRCSVGGVAVPGYLWFVMTGDTIAYSDYAWGVDSGVVPVANAFWTQFNTTVELV